MLRAYTYTRQTMVTLHELVENGLGQAAGGEVGRKQVETGDEGLASKP